jgi:hypothetical protein
VSKSPFSNNSGLARSHLGDQGELWFAAALPQGWVWQPPRRDVGKDGLIVIRDGSTLHNIEFSVQIKTSERPKIREENVLLAGVSRASIQYWFASPLPTLVVAVDIRNRKAWYAWHLDLFHSPKEFYESKWNTFTIRIPTKNILDNAGWVSIRGDLQDHYRAMQRAFANISEIPKLIVAINNIVRIVGNLFRVGASAPPDPPFTEREAMTLLIEQIEIRDLIDTVRSLLSRVDETSDAHKQIAFWLTSFEDIVNSAYPRLHTLPPKGHDIPADLELAIAPKRILEARPKLVLAAVDLVRLLTSPIPS